MLYLLRAHTALAGFGQDSLLEQDVTAEDQCEPLQLRSWRSIPIDGCCSHPLGNHGIKPVLMLSVAVVPCACVMEVLQSLEFKFEATLSRGAETSVSKEFPRRNTCFQKHGSLDVAHSLEFLVFCILVCVLWSQSEPLLEYQKGDLKPLGDNQQRLVARARVVGPGHLKYLHGLTHGSPAADPSAQSSRRVG